MDNGEILRQEAIRLILQGHAVKEVAERVGKTRQWVYKWINIYNKEENKSCLKVYPMRPNQYRIRFQKRSNQQLSKLESAFQAIFTLKEELVMSWQKS